MLWYLPTSRGAKELALSCARTYESRTRTNMIFLFSGVRIGKDRGVTQRRPKSNKEVRSVAVLFPSGFASADEFSRGRTIKSRSRVAGSPKPWCRFQRPGVTIL